MALPEYLDPKYVTNSNIIIADGEVFYVPNGTQTAWDVALARSRGKPVDDSAINKYKVRLEHSMFKPARSADAA